MGRRSTKPGSTTYLKVCAAFKCSKAECGKSWRSLHGWGRENDGVYCEFCDKRARLINAADETLKLDTYICGKAGCGQSWVTIHGDEEGEGPPQKCDGCQLMVKPNGPPQERFGRHYWFKCYNQGCSGEEPEWEDFSLETQKTQRCNGCRSAGIIIRTTRFRFNPHYHSRGRGRTTKKENGGGDAGGPRDPGHNADLCDMCQEIIRSNRGRSCEQWKRVETEVVTQEDGGVGEKIVTVS